MFRFKDLRPNKSNSARRIELFAPLHLIAEKVLVRARQASDEAIMNEVNKRRMIRQKSKSKEEIKRLETYNDRVMIKKLKGVDSALKDVDFDINIEVNKIGANVTGNQNFYELSNHRLLEVGLLNQVISIKKEGPILLMNMGGITVSTFF